MARVFTFVMFATVLMLLLEISGIPTAFNPILQLIGLGTDNASVNVSSLYDILFNASSGIFLAGAAVGIAISFFTRSTPENLLLLPLITGILAGFVGTFISVANYFLASGQSWLSMPILVIFGAITVGYLISLAEFLRGTA